MNDQVLFAWSISFPFQVAAVGVFVLLVLGILPFFFGDDDDGPPGYV